MLKVKKTSFEQCPEGSHPARITTIADLGMQKSTYKGADRISHRIGITYELTNKKTKEGHPFAVFDTLTHSLNEKSRLFELASAVYKRVPDELDLPKLLGKLVLVSVVHRDGADGKSWANVKSVTSLRDGMKVNGKTKTELLLFDLDEPNPEVYQKLPALFRKEIEQRMQPVAQEEESEELEDVPY